MSDDPLDALARANPFPNELPVDVPDIRASAMARPGRWLDRGGVAASVLLGATLGWTVIAALGGSTREPPAHRCVVIGSVVVAETDGLCLSSGRQ